MLKSCSNTQTAHIITMTHRTMKIQDSNPPNPKTVTLCGLSHRPCRDLSCISCPGIVFFNCILYFLRYYFVFGVAIGPLTVERCYKCQGQRLESCNSSFSSSVIERILEHSYTIVHCPEPYRFPRLSFFYFFLSSFSPQFPSCSYHSKRPFSLVYLTFFISLCIHYIKSLSASPLFPHSITFSLTFISLRFPPCALSPCSLLLSSRSIFFIYPCLSACHHFLSRLSITSS